MLLGMVTRVTLGHSGRPINAGDQTTWPLFWLFQSVPLLRIAGEAVAQAEGEPGRPGVYRELTMTWQAQPPAHNTLLAGRWWQPGERGQVSVEQGVAERLGIRLGDSLRFSVEGREITARVSSLRKVNWEDLQPNFFMIFSTKNAGIVSRQGAETTPTPHRPAHDPRHTGHVRAGPDATWQPWTVR